MRLHNWSSACVGFSLYHSQSSEWNVKMLDTGTVVLDKHILYKKYTVDDSEFNLIIEFIYSCSLSDWPYF